MRSTGLQSGIKVITVIELIHLRVQSTGRSPENHEGGALSEIMPVDSGDLVLISPENSVQVLRYKSAAMQDGRQAANSEWIDALLLKHSNFVDDFVRPLPVCDSHARPPDGEDAARQRSTSGWRGPGSNPSLSPDRSRAGFFASSSIPTHGPAEPGQAAGQPSRARRPPTHSRAQAGVSGCPQFRTRRSSPGCGLGTQSRASAAQA